jgi:hypothetical protein
MTPTLLREHLGEIAGNASIITDYDYWTHYLEFSDELFDGKEFSIKFDFDYRNTEALKPDTTSIIYQLKDVNETANWYWESWNRDYESYSQWGSFFNSMGWGTEEEQARRVEIVVELQSISRDYYHYLRTRNLSERTGDNPFGEPIQIFNNIQNGIGILGGYTSSVYRFEVTPERHPSVPKMGVFDNQYQKSTKTGKWSENPPWYLIPM